MNCDASGVRRRIRLLLVITQSNWGGAQRYVHDLALGLPASIYDVTVAAGHGGPLLDLLSREGIKTLGVTSLVRSIEPLHDLQALIALKRAMTDGQFDIVHANSTKAGFIARLAAWWAGVPIVVYTVHGLVLNEPLPPITWMIYWLMEKLGSLFTHQFIAVSQFDLHALDRFHIAEPAVTRVIYPGIASFPITASDSSRCLLVGAIAGFYPTKGLQYLLQAFATVASRHQDIRFMLIGHGPLEQFVRTEIVRLDLGHRISIVNAPMDARSYLGQFAMLVVASVKEGLPYVVSEAMFSGTPVIATSVGGIPEQIVDGETGLLVSPRDPAALAAAIEHLADDAALRGRVAIAARTRAGKMFGIDTMLQSTSALYERLVAQHSVSLRR